MKSSEMNQQMNGRNVIGCCEASSGWIETGVSWKVEKRNVAIFYLFNKLCMWIYFVKLLQNEKLQNKSVIFKI